MSQAETSSAQAVDHQAVLFNQVQALDETKRRYSALELSLLQWFDTRAEQLNLALAAAAGCYGVVLSLPLEMDEKGVYPMTADAADDVEALAAFSNLVAKHGASDRHYETGALPEGRSWFRLHHYPVERLVREVAAERGFSAGVIGKDNR